MLYISTVVRLIVRELHCFDPILFITIFTFYFYRAIPIPIPVISIMILNNLSTVNLHILCYSAKTIAKGVMAMDGQELAKQTLDQIPQAASNAKRIVGLVKEGGRITGYQLSDNSVVAKQQAVTMAKQGRIAGVGIAHRGDTEYLKSIPDGSENNNLGSLPSVSPETQA